MAYRSSLLRLVEVEEASAARVVIEEDISSGPSMSSPSLVSSPKALATHLETCWSHCGETSDTGIGVAVVGLVGGALWW